MSVAVNGTEPTSVCLYTPFQTPVRSSAAFSDLLMHALRTLQLDVARIICSCFVPSSAMTMRCWCEGDIGDGDGVTIVFECDLRKGQVRAFNCHDLSAH